MRYACARIYQVHAYRFHLQESAKEMGNFFNDMASSAASSAGSGLVGMGLNLIGGLFNKGMSQEEAMRMQYENEIKKMQEQYNLNREMAKYSQELNKFKLFIQSVAVIR